MNGSHDFPRREQIAETKRSFRVKLNSSSAEYPVSVENVSETTVTRSESSEISPQWILFLLQSNQYLFWDL